MNQITKSTYTKEDIVSYVEGMQIKKANIGGYDRVDVYVQIQELLKMYSIYLDSELDKQKDTLIKQQKEIKELTAREKEAREELNSRIEMDGKKEQKFQRQKEEISDLLKYKELAEKQQAENEALKRQAELWEKEVTELKKSDSRVPELQNTVEEYKQKIKELSEEIEKLNSKESEASSADMLELMAKLRKQADENTTLKDKLEESQAKLKEQQELNSYMKQEGTSRKDDEKLRELQGELSQYQKLAMGLKQKIQQQSEEIEKLSQKEPEISPSETLVLKEELRRQTEETAVLKDKLKEYQELLTDYLKPTSGDMQGTLKDRERIIVEKDQEILAMTQRLRDREEELADLRKQKEGVQVQTAQNYTQEIGAILREARREGENIINNSRVEAEQEMIRLLDLRAKFTQEKEVYRSWCKRVDEEKRAIEEFLEQFSSQYKHVDGTLNTIRERTSSLKLNGQTVDNQQDGIKGIDYGKKGLE